MCDSHYFIQFADGHVTGYHPDTPPKDLGLYTKVSRNTYAWQIPGNKKPITLHVGWFLIHGESNEPKVLQAFWGWRDWQFKDCARIVRETQALPAAAKKSKS
jgi:hypothetical protein